MDVITPHAMLAEVERLRKQVKADRHDASIPLAVFGVAMLLAAVATAINIIFSIAFWIPGVPVALAVTWWMYRKQAAKTGIAPKGRVYLLAGIWAPIVAIVVAGPVALVVLGITLLFFPLPTVAALLLIVGLLQRSRYLWSSALAFGGVAIGILSTWALLAGNVPPIKEGNFLLIAARLLGYPLGKEGETSYIICHNYTLVYAGLGLLLITLAVIARKRENHRG